jgi:RNA recognition motif-containing protein
VFISGLHTEIDEHRLRVIFGEFGVIENVKIRYNQRVFFEGTAPKTQQESTGIAYVCYMSRFEAERAILQLNGKQIMGQKVYVALWRPKED